MAKQGRPRKYGRQPAWMLERGIMVLHAFNEARKNGEKYDAAITAAIDAVKGRHPKMRTGPRMVKGILAEWQPNGSSQALVVSKVSEAELDGAEMQRSIRIFQEMGWPKDKKVKVLTVSLGPRPEYPRVNAKRPQGPSESGQ